MKRDYEKTAAAPFVSWSAMVRAIIAALRLMVVSVMVAIKTYLRKQAQPLTPGEAAATGIV